MTLRADAAYHACMFPLGSAARMRLAGWVVAFGAAVAGCGSSGPPPDPTPFIGVYNVMIAGPRADGRMMPDSDVMTVTRGSGTSVLLDFRATFAPPDSSLGIRATVAGSTMLTIPRQTIRVDRAPGAAAGFGVGMGTIDASGMVNLSLTLTIAGEGPPDAGAGGGPITYTFTGSRQ